MSKHEAKVWLEDHPSVRPHFAALRTMMHRYERVRSPEDAGVLVGTVESILQLSSTALTADRAIATNAFGSPEGSLTALVEAYPVTSAGDMTAMTVAQLAPSISLEMLKATAPAFVEVLVQHDSALPPQARVAELLWITYQLGLPQEIGWDSSVTKSACALAGEHRQLGLNLAHRSAPYGDSNVEMVITSRAHRQRLMSPLSQSARPTTWTHEDSRGWRGARASFSPGLRDAWGTSRFPPIAEALVAARAAEALLRRPIVDAHVP